MIQTIITRGYGNGTFNGAIADVVLRGYAPGAEIVTQEETYTGGFFFDFPDRPPVKFRAVGKKEKEAKPILEDIAERIEPDADNRDLEIILRMRLRLAGLEYKKLYLTWLQRQRNELKREVKHAIKKKRQRQDEEMILLFSLIDN